MQLPISELIIRLDKLEQRLKEELPDIIAVYAGDAISEAWTRVQEQGAKPGATYSTNPMYAEPGIFNRKDRFKPRGKNFEAEKRGKAKLKGKGEERKTMYLPGGYKELRSIQGLPTNVVNLEYSGLLHKNIKVLKIEKINEFKVTAIVGATTEENKKKMKNLFKKYGNFLGVTPEIAKVINLQPEKRLRELVGETLGQS